MATKSDLKDMVSRIQFEKTVARLATKDDIRDMVTKDDIRGLLTEATFEREFARLYRFLLIGSLGWASLVIAVIKFL